MTCVLSAMQKCEYTLHESGVIPMSTTEFEKRLTSIERDLAELKSRVITTENPNHWVEKIASTFASPADKAAFDEAMRYGRKWRNEQRSKSRKGKASKK